MSLRLYRFLVLLLVVVPFLGTLLAIYLLWNLYVFPSDIVLMLTLVFLTGIGITIGYHRMLTHDGFQTFSVIRALLLIFGCMGFEGGPLGWAGRHVQHHAHSDEEGDPHSPLDGFWHAHFGWMFTTDDSFQVKKYVPHLFEDRVVLFVDKYQAVWMILSLVVPFLIGGWTGLLWGGAVRLFLTTHITFSVNSICHTFGTKPFLTTDESRNNWIIGLIGFGEGWHNNHHAFPRNAFHGLRWWQVDISGLLIRSMEAVGLVWSVQRVTDDTIVAQQQRAAAVHVSTSSMRDDVLASLLTMRDELSAMGAKITGNFAEHKAAQWKQFHDEAARRLEYLQTMIARSAHVKRHKLLSYQKEAQTLYAQAKEKWARLTAMPMSS